MVVACALLMSSVASAQTAPVQTPVQTPVKKEAPVKAVKAKKAKKAKVVTAPVPVKTTPVQVTPEKK